MAKGWGAVIACAALCATLSATPAQAAFPGQNGKIAFVRDGQIWTMNADGTNPTQHTTGPAAKFDPEWSPDGTRLAYSAQLTTNGAHHHVRVMNADGTGDMELIPARSLWASWSPDGQRLAFVTRRIDTVDCHGYQQCTVDELVVADADGSNRQVIAKGDFHAGPNPAYGPLHRTEWSPKGDEITFGDDIEESSTIYAISTAGGTRTWLAGEPSCCNYAQGAAWSPSSSKLAFIRGDYDGLNEQHLYTMNRDGTALMKLGGPNALGVEWSPDGRRLVVAEFSGLSSMNPDGTGKTPLTSGPVVDQMPDWQPIPINAYPRPAGAYPMRASLVPAYEPCVSPNRTHGPPLGFDSCSPPSQEPGQLTVGTPDSNGQGAKSLGHVRVITLTGNPATSADEADVRVLANITDVRMRSDLTDYTGDLEARFTIQITDKNNTPHPGGPGAATVQELTHSHQIPCAGTADTTVGSTCQLDTTVEALLPGAVVEKRRAIWELGAIRVHDGAGNLFLTQGLFVP